jgi:WD40 repeat protein
MDLAGQLALPGAVQVLRFSPDGTKLAGLSESGELVVWEVGSWTLIQQILGVHCIGIHLGRLDFSPDGKALVIGDADHRLRVVDLASGNTKFDIPNAHPEPIASVAWSPNGSVIASGSGYVGGPIQLWDATSGQPLGALEGHTSGVCRLTFSRNGLRLYSASGDQTIRIWDVVQQRCLATLRGSTDVMHGLALSPDGTTLASSCRDGVVAFWKAFPRVEVEPLALTTDRGAFGPAFAPDSRVLAVRCEGAVSLFDLATRTEMEPLPVLGINDIRMVTYSPDGTLLAGGSQSGKIRVWSCLEQRLLQELDGGQGPIHLLRFRSDGTRLFSIDATARVVWWDTSTWQAVRAFPAEFPGAAVAISPDGRLLAVAAKGVQRWLNAETGELLATTASPHRRVVGRINFSGDGSRAASVADDGTVAIWNASSFQLIATFKGYNMSGAHGVGFSPDGRTLATAGGGRDAVKLWDLSTRRQLVTLPAEDSQLSFVEFSPDGKWLAARGMEGKLYLWRAPSWAEIEAEEKRPESGPSP